MPEDIESEEERLKNQIDENLDEVFYWNELATDNDLTLSQIHYELLFEEKVMLYFLEGQYEVSKNFTFSQALQQVNLINNNFLSLLLLC